MATISIDTFYNNIKSQSSGDNKSQSAMESTLSAILQQAKLNILKGQINKASIENDNIAELNKRAEQNIETKKTNQTFQTQIDTERTKLKSEYEQRNVNVDYDTINKKLLSKYASYFGTTSLDVDDNKEMLSVDGLVQQKKEEFGMNTKEIIVNETSYTNGFQDGGFVPYKYWPKKAKQLQNKQKKLYPTTPEKTSTNKNSKYNKNITQINVAYDPQLLENINNNLKSLKKIIKKL